MDKREKNSDYVVPFMGTKMSKREANKVGLSIIVGFVGALISAGIFGWDNRLAALAVASVLAFIVYFSLGNKLY